MDAGFHPADVPLAFHPGTAWRYGLSIDVLGYIVQVVSGQPFDEFLKERIFTPLGMIDTDFWVPPEKVGALRVHVRTRERGRVEDRPVTRWKRTTPSLTARSRAAAGWSPRWRITSALGRCC